MKKKSKDRKGLRLVEPSVTKEKPRIVHQFVDRYADAPPSLLALDRDRGFE